MSFPIKRQEDSKCLPTKIISFFYKNILYIMQGERYLEMILLSIFVIIRLSF